MFINFYEKADNLAAKIGPMLKKKKQHKADMENPVYCQAYGDARSGKMSADQAWGQIFWTFVLVVLVAASAILWFLLTYIHHDEFSAWWAGVLFWLFVGGLIFLQWRYYLKIQDYAIDKAQEAVRQHREAEHKKAVAASDAQAKRNAEHKKQQQEQIKAAQARREAAEATPPPEEEEPPTEPEEETDEDYDDDGVYLEGFVDPLSDDS